MSISKIISNLKKNKKLPLETRIYLIDKEKHYFLNNGVLKNGFDSKLSIIKNRDSLLSAYSKMAFLFDEIIRLRIVQYSNGTDSEELLYLLNLVPINRKIRTFLDWKVFSPEFTRVMSRLFEVRNDTVHCISIDDVMYSPKMRVSLSTQSGFKKFSSDFQKAWKTLLAIYVDEQQKVDLEKICN